MKKRVLAMLLAVCMTLTLLPVSALAARSSREDQPLAEIAKGEEILDRAEEAAAKPAAADAQLAAADVSGEMSGSQLLATAAGGVITLTGDVTLTSKMGVNKDIVLDLNGHTVTATGSGYFNTIEVYSGKTLTVRDSGVGGKITDSGLTGSAFSADGVISSSGTLNLRGGTIESAKTNCVRVKGGATILDGAALVCTASMKSGIEIYQNAATTATAEIKSGTMESAQYGLNVGKNHNATMTGGTITVTGSQAHGVQVGGNCDVSLKNCTINATGSQSAGVYAGSNKLTLEDVVINGKSQAIFLNSECAVTVSGDKTHLTGSRVIVLNNGWSDSANSSLIITGGTVEGKIDRQGLQKLAKPVITGGTFTTDVSDYCAEGFEVRLKDDGSYGVIEKTVVAQITREGAAVPFYTLQDALADAREGETVTMLADETVSVWNQMGKIGVPLAANVILEGNSHTLTIGRIESNGNGSYITYGAEGLTVRNLTVDQTGVGNGGFSVTNGSTLDYVTVKGGGYAVLTGSDVTVKNCKFENVTHAIYTNEKGEGTGLKITDNTFSGGRAIILRSDEVFTGNTVEHSDTMLTVDTTEATVTNNEFKGSGKLSLYADTDMKENAILCGVKTSGSVAVDLSDNYWGEEEPTGLPEGVTVASRYTLWDDTSKTPSDPVATDAAVARVGERAFATLQAALTAANTAEDEAGRTVTLLKGDTQAIDLSKYADGLNNVTITAAEGVKCAGITVRSAGSMSGVTFRGIDFNATGNPCVDFELNDNAVENITFDDCNFTSNGQHMAIRMYRNTGRYQNITVTNCEFNACSQGVYVPAVNTLTVSGCTFNSVGIAVHPGDVGFGGTVRVTNNTFDYCNNDVIAFNNDEGAEGIITGNTSTHGLGWSRVSVSDGKTDSFTLSGNTWDGYADGADNVGWTERMVYWGDMYVHYYRVPAAAQVLDAEGQTLYGTLPSVETAVMLAESGQTIRILAEGDYDITGLAENVTVTVPDGYAQKTEGNTLTVAAAAAQVIAAADGAVTSYATIGEALTASNPGDTMKVLALPEEMVEIPNEKAVRLDCSEEVAGQKPAAWNAYSVQDWLAAYFDYQAKAYNTGATKFYFYGGLEACLDGEKALREKAGNPYYGDSRFYIYKDVTLTKDVTLPTRNLTTTAIYADRRTAEVPTLTLDLAGHTISQEKGEGWNGNPAVAAIGANLTIKDTGENKTGKIIGATIGADVYPNMKLTLESGTIASEGDRYEDWADSYGTVVRMYGGEFVMNGGTLSAAEAADTMSGTIAFVNAAPGTAFYDNATYALTLTGGTIKNVTAVAGNNGFHSIADSVNTEAEGKVTYAITGGTFDIDLEGKADRAGNAYLGTGYASPEDPENEGHFTVTTCTHEDTTVTREDVHEATCTEDGSYVEVTTCNTCGNVTRANKTIGKLGHNEAGSVTHKDATCTEPGVVGGVYCTRCNNGKEAAETAISALGHDLTKWAYDGVNHWHVCSRCDGDVTDTPAAHTWVQGTVSGGRRTDTCECGAERTVSVSTGGNSRPRPTPPEEDLNEPDVPLVEKPFLFTDVTADDWYYDAVKYVSAANMMIGVNAEGTLFAPALSTTRASVAQILFRLEKEPTASIADFGDVREGAWYTDAVNWNDEAGLMIGYGDGTFRPERNVSRQELVTVLYRYAKHLGLDVTADGDLSVFDDADEVAAWAEDAMAWAVNVGIIKGRNGTRLAPDGTASRSELASILQRFRKLTADAEA